MTTTVQATASQERSALEGSSSRKIIAGLVVLLLAQAALAAEDLPHVVVILADDLGWNDVGYHGGEIATPRLDALAAHGVVLDRFYAQPSCSPTRAALMTGKAPMRLGVLSPLSKNNPTGLPLAERLLPQYFRDAGYQTFMTGKWHLGHRSRDYLPNARGFEHFYGHVTGGIGYWDHVHGGGLDWQRNGKTLREAGYSTHLIADEAVRLIQGRDPERPMLLYASFNAPHLPNEAPPEAIERYRDIENPHRRVHAAMVGELDAAIGRVVDALEADGMLDRTLIWFMSDNGGLNPESFEPLVPRLSRQLEAWFGKPLPLLLLEFVRVNSLEGGADNSPYRKGKQSVYEGGARVPSFVYWPGRLAPRRSLKMVTAQDVLPTLLGAVGLEVPAPDLDGADQWPSIHAGAAAPTPDYVTQARDGVAFYRFPWKLIELGPDEFELYHLEEDPEEQFDRAAAQPEVVQTLAGALSAFPRGETVNLPLWRVLWDPDFFGGEEDREPWADTVK
ncbi:MAG: arylsulfatase [Myxococcota bacterium]|nr:arylsulfatase [Myxococcota bacterium]